MLRLDQGFRHRRIGWLPAFRRPRVSTSTSPTLPWLCLLALMVGIIWHVSAINARRTALQAAAVRHLDRVDDTAEHLWTRAEMAILLLQRMVQVLPRANTPHNTIAHQAVVSVIEAVPDLRFAVYFDAAGRVVNGALEHVVMGPVPPPANLRLTPHGTLDVSPSSATEAPIAEAWRIMASDVLMISQQEKTTGGQVVRTYMSGIHLDALHDGLRSARADRQFGMLILRPDGQPFYLSPSDVYTHAGEHLRQLRPGTTGCRTDDLWYRVGPVICWKTPHHGAFTEAVVSLDSDDTATRDAALQSAGIAALILAALVMGVSAIQSRMLQRINQRLNQEVEHRTAEVSSSEERFRTLVDTAPVGIVVHRDGYVVKGNEAFHAILGRVCYAYHRLPPQLVDVPLLRGRVGASIGGVVREIGIEGGPRIAVKCAATQLEWTDGPAIMLSVVDITEIQRAQDDLRRAMETAESALQMEKALNERQQRFISMASHEFRTPLSVIDARAQRLLRHDRMLRSDEVVEGVASIRGGVRRLTLLMDSVLSAARLDAGAIECRPVACDLAALVLEVCDRHRAAAPGATFHTDVERLHGIIVKGDRNLLDQVIDNLVSNAVKYGGARPTVAVGAWQDGGDVVIEVRDSGIGIPPDECGRIFDRFYRASTSIGVPGTGIGLDIVRTFVEMHGGTVGVHSEVGKGTTFRVTLPAGQQENAT